MKLKKKILFYLAVISKAHAYVKLLTIVGDIQKFNDVAGGRACFSDYPDMQKKCDMAKRSNYACTHRTCPLFGLNGLFVKAKKQYDDAERSYNQAQTALFCALVPDSQQLKK